MATRGTIKIEGINFAKIYKHWDCNPGMMLDWLTDFNNSFNKNRGHDPEYKFAQLLRFSQREGDNYNLDMSETTGWGVVKYEDDLGEEFEYTLTTKEVMVNDKYN
jgi:hypothetical protein